MKRPLKISMRERRMLAFAPAVLIGGIYLLWIEGSLATELQKQQSRAAAAFAPAQQSSQSPALAKAKKDYANVCSGIDQRTVEIAQLQKRADDVENSIYDNSGGGDAAQLIGSVERVFALQGIKPVISEEADYGNGARNVPQSLVDKLYVKTEFDNRNSLRRPHLWHLIFDDQIENFEIALQNVTEQIPSVVPLSMNLVYNPEDDGQSRLLELWILY
jgi:hypothetical protein